MNDDDDDDDDDDNDNDQRHSDNGTHGCMMLIYWYTYV